MFVMLGKIVVCVVCSVCACYACDSIARIMCDRRVSFVLLGSVWSFCALCEIILVR